MLHNNPHGQFYESRGLGHGVANKSYLLKDVVRASTAAPHYFDPDQSASR